MKKILVLTGTRADFGKLKRLMAYIEDSSGLELHVYVTGMHMLNQYGGTYREVQRENFKHMYCSPNQHTGEPMCSVLGNTVSQLSRLSQEIQPDMILVHGDRLEALAGATVGALSNRLVCHIEGGELSGTVDDLIRHSISKLAHIHMVANEEARNRLIQMGENPSSIFVIGSPDLDVMSAPNLPSIIEARERYGIQFRDFAIAMFHPVTTEEKEMFDHANSFFSALQRSGDNYIVVYPNNDSGSADILKVLEGCRPSKNFLIYPSLRFEHFLVLLKNAKYIIGNSSAGIREAPFYGVPTVNVGTRQSRRFFGSSVINSGYSTDSILLGIEKVKRIGHFQPSNHFGDGDSVSKFAQAITSADFWKIPVQKVFLDHKWLSEENLTRKIA